jgi:hypothetical protein
MSELDDVLFEYVAHCDPKSEHLKRFLRRFPNRRRRSSAITATWRALSILDKALPVPKPDPPGGAADMAACTSALARPTPSPGEGRCAMTKQARCR